MLDCACVDGAAVFLDYADDDQWFHRKNSDFAGRRFFFVGPTALDEIDRSFGRSVGLVGSFTAFQVGTVKARNHFS